MIVSSIKNAQKPNKGQTGRIVENIKNTPNVNDLKIKDLATLLGEGRSVVLENIRRGHANQKNGVINSLYIGLDFDDIEATNDYTRDMLRSLSIVEYMRYNTFTYSEDHQKHRVILKFDRLLSLDELNVLYKYLGDILKHNDESTEAIGRLWHGTSHEITETPGHINNADMLLHRAELHGVKAEEIKEHDNKLYDITKYNNHNIEGLYDDASNLISKWETGDNNDIYLLFYGAGALYDHDGGAFYKHLCDLTRERFKDDPKKLKKQLNEYCKDNFKRAKNNPHYTNMGRSLLNKYNIFEYAYQYYTIYNVVNHVNPVLIEQYLTAEHINAIDLTKHNLLYSPAGSGKTSVLMVRLERENLPTIFLVPTRILVLDLKAKQTQRDNPELYAFYCEGEGDCYDETKIFVGTYDQYERIERDLIDLYGHGNYNLIIDEGHECAEFFKMNKNQDKNPRLKMMLNYHRATILTATPYNLPNTFDHIHAFASNKPKKVEIIVTEDRPTTIVDSILKAKDEGRVFVYLNHINGIETIEKQLHKRDPNLNILIVIGGTKKDKDLTNLTKEKTKIDEIRPDMTYNVVLCTKVCNMGIDIQGVFKTSIYATTYNSKFSTNAVFQFASRDRQCDNFIVIYDGRNGERYKINTPKLHDDMGDNTARDKQAFNECFITNEAGDPEQSEVLTTHKQEQYTSLKPETLKNLMLFVNPKWDITITMLDEEEPETREDKANYKPLFITYYDTGQFKNDLALYMNKAEVYTDVNNVLKASIFYDYPRGLRDRISYLFVIFKTYIQRVSEYGYLPEYRKEMDANEFSGYISPSEFDRIYNALTCDYGADDVYMFRSLHRITLIDNPKVNKDLYKLLTGGIISIDQVTSTCDLMNSERLLYNNKAWKIPNFTTHMYQATGVTIKKHNKRDQTYKVHNIFIDIPPKINGGDIIKDRLNKHMDQVGHITSKERTDIIKQCKNLGLFSSNDDFNPYIKGLGFELINKSKRIEGVKYPVKVFIITTI